VHEHVDRTDKLRKKRIIAGNKVSCNLEGRAPKKQDTGALPL